MTSYADPAQQRRRGRVSHVEQTLARDRLGVPLVTGHALSGSAPFTVVAAGITTGFAIVASPGLPLMYLVIAAGLMLFSIGMVAMARRIVNAGSLYTYIAQGLGRPAGVAAAFVATLAYNMMQVGLYGGIGAITSGFASQAFGLANPLVLPWWAWALLAWFVVGLFGLLRIDINGMVLGILLAAEIILIVIYDLVLAGHPSAGTFDLSALSLSHLDGAALGAGGITAMAGYVGYEATTVFSEEARDPRRTIARATFLSLALVGALYFVSATLMTVAAGSANVIDLAGQHTTELLFFLVSPHLPVVFIHIGHTLVITSLFAALLAFHNTCARYAYALGREKVLPSGLASTGRSGAPKGGSLLQSGIGLLFIAIFGLAGFDPIVHMFFWLTTFGALGVMVLMVLTSIAVIAYFNFRDTGKLARETAWSRLIAPGLAVLVLGWVLWENLSGYHSLLGVPAGDFWAMFFPLAMLAVFLLGLAWSGLLKIRQPGAYQTIGQGASASPLPGTDHA